MPLSWPGLPCKGDSESQWDLPGKIKVSFKKSHFYSALCCALGLGEAETHCRGWEAVWCTETLN